MTRLASILILLCAFACLAAGDQSSRFEKVGHTLMCTCGCNQVLLECNHVGCPNSDSMRAKLSDLISAGASDESIYRQFISDYGNIVVAAPIGRGFNRLAWVAPFAFLFAGVLAIGVVARKWSHARPSEIAPPSGDPLRAFRDKARRETSE